ncbi:MAG: hypothetical protein AAB956_02785 [Patescibacteria group bacterium]
MKKYTVLFVGLALVLPAVAGAAEFRSGQTVSFNETMKDNVYVAGGTVNLVGTVDGDLYVAGGTVNLMGTVTKDVVVFGGTVIVTGKVGDDLRIGGGNVTVGGTIGGELAAGSGNINVLPGTLIAGGAYIGAGDVIMNGTVAKNLVIAGNEIALGAGLKVGGNFDYYSNKEAKIDASAKISGATNFHQQAIKGKPAGKASAWAFFVFLTFWGLVCLAGAIILAWLLFYLWREDSKEMIEAAFASPGKELLRGFITFFILPIAAIICWITLIGLPLGFLIGFGFAVLTILAAAVSGLLAAALLAKVVFQRKETEINWWLIILGLVIMAIIKLIPFVGWLLAFLFYLVGFGVLSNMIYKKLAPNK